MKYKVYSDGAARGNPGAAGAGFVVYDENMAEINTSSFALGETTNNVAEYEALVRAAEYVAQLKPQHVDFLLDSELIVKQVSGIYKVKAEHLIPYYTKFKSTVSKFSYTCMHVRRQYNKVADSLANKGADESEKQFGK